MHRTLWCAYSLSLAALLIAIVLPLLVHAESVVWSTTVSRTLIRSCLVPLGADRQCSGPDSFGFGNPTISVQYRAVVKKAATGEIIPPGGSVLRGTRLVLSFDRHASEDIYWFSTGFGYDSPYGEWRAQASAPRLACLEKDFVGHDRNGVRDGKIYAALVAAPPNQTVQGVGNLSCGEAAENGSRTCTASDLGTVPLSFSFAATRGRFYGRLDPTSGPLAARRCTGNNEPMWVYKPAASSAGRSQGNFLLTVPTQTIPYPITVTDTTGSTPSAPTVSGSGQCTIGTSHTITFYSTDSDGDQVRYGVDWDADGTVDQFVPSSGYVASGVAQSASRTYTTAGGKTIKVIAFDKPGFSSGWTTFRFTCSGTQNLCSNGLNKTTYPSCTCPTGQKQSGSSCVDIGTLCSNGLNKTAYPSCQCTPPQTQSGAYCIGGGGGGTPALLIRAVPSLVRPGDTTTVSWSAANVVGNSCKVTSPSDPLANGTGAWSGALSSGVATSQIQSQTVYTLSCTGLDGSILTQSTTVNVVPLVREL
ncbi:MAG: hypothetical protein Q7S50_02025 [bacterium]|nr:hypothetical protein [bacterium]